MFCNMCSHPVRPLAAGPHELLERTSQHSPERADPGGDLCILLQGDVFVLNKCMIKQTSHYAKSLSTLLPGPGVSNKVTCEREQRWKASR